MPGKFRRQNDMLERIDGIVMSVIRHNDKHNVVTLYTRQHGRMAFLAPVGSSKTGRMRNATLSLMAVVSADVNIRPGKELYTLRQVNPLRIWHGIYGNPVKSSLIYFLSEFCNRLVRQYPADEKLWLFLMQSLETLETLPTKKTGNFHIAFLTRLLPIAGIEPSPEGWREGDRFDMLSGEMIGSDPMVSLHVNQVKSLPNILDKEESRYVPLLMRINFNNMCRFRLTPEQRYRILNRLLAYYSIHLPLGGEFKTLPVLRELFA